jgi:tol-pal system protein YbgF
MEQIQVTTKSSDVDPALISKLRADVSNLSNMVEFHSNRITSLLESSESDANAILDLQEKLDGKQGKNKKTYAKTTETNNTQSPEILYNDSKKYYDANRLDESLEGFKTFLKDFPRHNLAANSQYWMGEIYYDIDNFDKALLEFEKVEDNYPGSLKAPDAKFKVAMCYLKLEKKTDAVKTLNDLKRFYPDYERMYKVDQFLESLQ